MQYSHQTIFRIKWWCFSQLRLIGLIGKEKNTSTLELLQRGQFSHICCNLHVVSVLLVKMVKPGQDLAKMKPSDLPPTYHGHAGKEDSITRDQSVHEGSKNNMSTFFHERQFTTVHFSFFRNHSMPRFEERRKRNKNHPQKISLANIPAF